VGIQKEQNMQTDIQNFLTQLLESQIQMLDVLKRQQAILAKPERDVKIAKEMEAAISAEETEILAKLQAVLDRREELLTCARLQNIRGNSIEELCGHLFPHNVEIQKMLVESKYRSQQIQLLAYTNWTMNRKSSIHCSQILELLETRGQGKTTYQTQPNKESSREKGGRVDRVA
jgi:hypothetical protein